MAFKRSRVRFPSAPPSETNDESVASVQAERFAAMMRTVLGGNTFYTAKLAPLGFSADRPPQLVDLTQLPLTTKVELVRDQQEHPPYGTNLTFPVADYVRQHRTSGTTGRPLYWLDTADSWHWWLECWGEVYRSAGVSPADVVYVPAPGPSIGFSSAFEASQLLGALTINGGGLTTVKRLEAIDEYAATVLVCTPTYALRLLESGAEQGLTLTESTVRVTIHCGEPGASIPSVKRRLEKGWGASCVDHAGATEVGAWGVSCGVDQRLHILEEEFVAEVIDPESEEPAAEGERGELVLTNLGRLGSPVVRYRTGDVVTLSRQPCACGRSSAFLEGGIVGRTDDMIFVRGVNVFPSAIENIVREFPAVGEFEMRVREERAMRELVVRIELEGDGSETVADTIRDAIQQRLGLRPSIETVRAGTLPRYEAKSRRVVLES